MATRELSAAAGGMSIFRKLQLVSGLACGFFLFLHVLTVASLVVDPGAFDQVLFTFRQVYRPSEFLEALLVWTPLALHLLASLGVAFEGRQAPASRSVRWLRWSGTLLLVLLGGHVLIARILPAVEGYSATASYLAFGFENWPWGMIPYYLAIALAGAFHMGMGAAVALDALGVMRGSERLRLITGFTWTGLLALALLLGTCRVMVEAPNMDPTYYSSYQRLFEHNLPWLHARNPRVR